MPVIEYFVFEHLQLSFLKTTEYGVGYLLTIKLPNSL